MNEVSEARVVRDARTAGAVYLLYFLAAFGSAILMRGLVVSLWLVVNGVDASALVAADKAVLMKRAPCPLLREALGVANQSQGIVLAHQLHGPPMRQPAIACLAV